MDCLTENVFKDKAFDVFVYLKALCVLFTARSLVQTMYLFIQTSKKGAHEFQKKFFLFRCLLFSQNLSYTYLLPPILTTFPPHKSPKSNLNRCPFDQKPKVLCNIALWRYKFNVISMNIFVRT